MNDPMGSQSSTTFLQALPSIIPLGIIFLRFILGTRSADSWSTAFLSSIASVHNKGDDFLHAFTPSSSNTVKRRGTSPPVEIWYFAPVTLSLPYHGFLSRPYEVWATEVRYLNEGLYESAGGL